MNLILLIGIIAIGNPSVDGPAIQVAVRECTNYSCSKFQYGSGIITRRKKSGEYVAITNRHVLEMARPNPNATKTAYVMIGGNWIEAKEGGKSLKVDLALLTFRFSGQLGVMPISATAPEYGSTVHLYSFRRRGALMRQAAKISARSTNGGDLTGSDYLTADVWDGQSGGGVIQNGRLVGVIYARDSKPRGFRGLITGYKYTGMGICVDHSSLKEFAIKEGYRFEASGNWQEADTKPKKFTRKSKPVTTEVVPDAPKPPVVAKPKGKIDKIDSKLSKLMGIVAKLETLAVDAPKPSTSILKRAVIFAGTSAGLSVAGASGVGTAAMVALWLYRRRKNKKGEKSPFNVSSLSQFNRGRRSYNLFKTTRHSLRPYHELPVEPLLVPPTNDTKCTIKSESCPIKSVPITVQTPPTVNVHTENVYVPVELDTYREAVQYSHAQLVKRYPSAEGSVAFIDGMVDRYLSGQHLKG